MGAHADPDGRTGRAKRARTKEFVQAGTVFPALSDEAKIEKPVFRTGTVGNHRFNQP
jgi:hypothetical protein